jgi:AAA family ATP:ADP antiporter
MSIAAEYGITRPASNSLFLTAFSSKGYPWVWLATMPLNLLVIYLYSRFLPKIGPLKMIASVALSAVVINVSCAFLVPVYPKLIFFHYAWKDIYILLMFKQFWSMVHSTIEPKKAKFFYGLIFGMGTLGSVLGSMIPGFLAVEIGTEQLLLFTLPVYLVLFSMYFLAYERSGLKAIPYSQGLSDPRPREGLAMIRRSSLLMGVLLLVVLMQVSVALTEYRFNAHLEINILEKDLRTAYMGKLVGAMNMLSGLFQFVGGYFMLNSLGVKRSHFLIPLVLCGSAIVSWFIPTFAVVTFTYVLLKAIDFSLFGVVREMLYIPMQLDEKFRAKAIIDVFAYRTSKAAVSLCILALQATLGAILLPAVGGVSVAIFVLWMIVVSRMFKKHPIYS